MRFHFSHMYRNTLGFNFEAKWHCCLHMDSKNTLFSSGIKHSWLELYIGTKNEYIYICYSKTKTDHINRNFEKHFHSKRNLLGPKIRTEITFTVRTNCLFEKYEIITINKFWDTQVINASKINNNGFSTFYMYWGILFLLSAVWRSKNKSCRELEEQYKKIKKLFCSWLCEVTWKHW